MATRKALVQINGQIQGLPAADGIASADIEYGNVIPEADNNVTVGSSSFRFSEINGTSVVARGDTTNTLKSTLSHSGLASTNTIFTISATGNTLALTGAAITQTSTGYINLQATTNTYIGHGTDLDIQFQENGVTGATLKLDLNGQSRLRFAEGITSILIDQNTRTSDASCGDIIIKPQSPWASATAGNRIPGNVVIQVGLPTNGGTTTGSFFVTNGTAEILRVYSSATTDGGDALIEATNGYLGLRSSSEQVKFQLSDGSVGVTWDMSARALQIAADNSSFDINWAQDASAAGGVLSIRGQRGASGQIGGDLIIAGGLGGTSGTNSAGAVRVKLGAPVTGATAPLYLEREDGTKIFTMYEIAAGTSAIYSGDTGGTAAMTIRGSSVGVESSSTLVSIQPNTDLYLGHGSSRDIFHRDVGTVVLTEHLDADGATYLRFGGVGTTITSVSIDFSDTTGATGASMSVRGQNSSHAAGAGGPASLSGGTGLTGGTVYLSAGNGSGTNASGGHVEITGGNKTGSGKNGNIGLHASPGSWNNGERVTFLANATTAPTANPTSGLYFWSESGKIRSRTPNGIIEDLSYEDSASGGTEKSFQKIVRTDTDIDAGEGTITLYQDDAANIPSTSTIYYFARVMMRNGTNSIVELRHAFFEKESPTTTIDSAYDLESEQRIGNTSSNYAADINSLIWEVSSDNIRLRMSAKTDNWHVTAWIERYVIDP